MTRRARRNMMIHEAWIDQESDSRIIYEVGQSVPSSTVETYFYDSASVKELWVLSLDVSAPRLLELILKKDGVSGQNFISPLVIPAGNASQDLLTLLPPSAIRSGIEMGLGFTLKARLDGVAGATGKIIINGFVEEVGVAYEINPST